MSHREFLRAANISYFIHAEIQSFKGRVLDVGCGSKPYKRIFPHLEWVGLDLRPVGEIQADFHRIPEPDSSYDTVLCTDALQFAEDPQRVVAEMARVLKEEGLLLLVVPGTDVDDGSAFWGFRAEGLRLLCERAGLYVHRYARVEFPGGGIITGMASDFSEVDAGQVLLGTQVMGWAKKMDEMMPTMYAAVAGKHPPGGESSS